MYTSNLASRWRPKTFQEVIGQGHGLKILRHFLKKGKPHPAILLSGTRGIGKTTLARIFAKSLNCEVGITQTPCLVCSSCQATQIGEDVDVLEIDAASKTKVEDIRDLMDNIGYLPLKSRYKVYLLDEVHMLSRHSFNALLKVLEEPPSHVQFLFATTEPEKLPQTFRSRLLEIQLRPVGLGELVQYLAKRLDEEKIIYAQGVLELITQAAQGSVREALTLLDQGLGQRDTESLTLHAFEFLNMPNAHSLAIDLLSALVRSEHEKIPAIFRQFDSVESMYPLVDRMILWLQHAAANQVYRIGLWPPDKEAEKHLTPFKADLMALKPAQVIQAYQMALTAKKELEWVPCPKLAVEMFAVRWREQFAPSPSASLSSQSEADASTGPAEKHVKIEPTRKLNHDDLESLPVQQPEQAVTPVENRNLPLSSTLQTKKGLMTENCLPSPEKTVVVLTKPIDAFAQAHPLAFQCLRLPVGPVAKQLLWHSIILPDAPEGEIVIQSSQAFSSFQTDRIKEEILSAWNQAYPDQNRKFIWEVKRRLTGPSLYEQFKALEAEKAAAVQANIFQDPLSQALQKELSATLEAIVSAKTSNPNASQSEGGTESVEAGK